MDNPFIYSDANKRYHTLDYYLKKRFGTKVFKVSLNAGFTCPNIDGTKGFGGCTYCSKSGSGDFAGDRQLTLTEQFNTIKEAMHKKWPIAKYIGYFQARTNTYAPVEELKEKYEEIIALENVVGLAIATRADSIGEDVLNLLEDISKRTYLTVELGLQSVFNQTGIRINRGHSYEEFLECLNRLNERNINVCVHIINGLPGETTQMMVETARKLSVLKLHSVKIHLLHVIAGTQLAHQYQNCEFDLMSLEQYVQTVCDQLELFSPRVVIQRVTGDGDPQTLIGPKWSLKKFVVINEIDKCFLRRDSMQGSKFIRDGVII